MVFRVHVRLPAVLRRKARAYMRSIANPERCPRCQSRDTWKWTRNHGLIASVAKSFGRQLLTCRSCGNLFYTRAGNALPPLAKALVGIGFEPEPAVRMKRRALPPALPAEALRLTAAEEPTGEFVSASSVSASGEFANGFRNGAVEQHAFEDLKAIPELSSMASEQAAETAFARSAAGSTQRPVPILDTADQPAEGQAAAALATSASEFAEPEPEPVKAARKLPKNVRTWQDQAWDVRDWEGNPVASQPAPLSSDTRKAS